MQYTLSIIINFGAGDGPYLAPFLDQVLFILVNLWFYIKIRRKKMINSQRHDEKTFYQSFLQNLENFKRYYKLKLYI